ncbi:hypothetical protein DSO57_1017594 [Entomophthora muscae]|uniref:Uncharacterized protein n=1 Tax=Entomophthora muscae TaxID=34485 RepID=A0ACC2RJ62_9FUNG|nr:hypothetical protein DSO57_1017594 [Entomophthora muscae]
MMPNLELWSLLGQSVSYIIKLAPILWWALPSGPAVFQPEPTNASTYAWLPGTVVYSTIDIVTTSKIDPTFYKKVTIPCVEPDGQDAAVPTKGQHQLTDSECEALLNCLNNEMAVWDIFSQFGVTARYIGNLNTKYSNTGQISKSVKAKQ